MLATKTDINGQEFDYCPEHSSDATSSLEAFSGCELEDNPDCHPARTACLNLVTHLYSVMADFKENRNYSVMLFPAREDYDADEGYPGGPNDKRVYLQHFSNDLPTGPPEPMFSNQNEDGTYRFECGRCERDCGRCSWNSFCVCVPPCTAAEEGSPCIAASSEEDDEWDEPEGDF
jgi:hypothetical protein